MTESDRDQCFMCLHWRSNHKDVTSCANCNCDGFREYDEPGPSPFQIWGNTEGLGSVVVVDVANDCRIIARPRDWDAAEAYVKFKTAGRFEKLRKARGDE